MSLEILISMLDNFSGSISQEKFSSFTRILHGLVRIREIDKIDQFILLVELNHRFLFQLSL